jgi:hypothetical protein
MNNNADQKHRGVGILLNTHEEKGRAFKIKIERIKNQCLLFKLNERILILIVIIYCTFFAW